MKGRGGHVNIGAQRGRTPLEGSFMEKKHDFMVRFAGEGGQGVVTAAEALAQAAAQVGYHVMTFSTFPSQIMGGPTWTQARVSTQPVLSNGDELDVLVAFNREAYDSHSGEVGEHGVIVYDSASFQLEDDPYALGIPFDELGRSTGNLRAANMVVLGVLAKLIDWPDSYMEDFVSQRFARGRAGDDEIIRSNHQALGLGRDEAEKTSFSLGELSDPTPPKGDQILIRGNDAISVGAMTAGVDYYIGYPISPATPILVFMERNLVGPGKFAYQASSEIESIAATFGAGFAGKKAMTATSGPGLSLMSEGIGLGWMAEIPAVIVNVQRGGPATGLPTKTEQSDLLMALSPAHGDSRMPVIAPGTVTECFQAAVTAFNWAERYQGPVIVLSEMMLAERAQNIPRPDVEGTVVENRAIYRGKNGYERYEAAEVSPMPIPGGPGAYVANASEHDSIGDTTHLPQRHIHMTERRFSKLGLLEDGTYERQNADERIAIMPWGGSKGPALEAYNQLVDEGEKLAWFYTMFLHPLPPKLLEELRSKDLVIVPELNFQGQFSGVLRMLSVKAESITQYTGLPFKVGDLVNRVRERTSVAVKESVTA